MWEWVLEPKGVPLWDFLVLIVVYCMCNGKCLRVCLDGVMGWLSCLNGCTENVL